MPPAGIWKFCPAVIAAAVIEPEATNEPPDAAVHRETFAYVSDVETDVQLIAALLLDEPPEGAENAPTACLVLLPATLLVPAAPGAPV
jgi:hypothetical protein